MVRKCFKNILKLKQFQFCSAVDIRRHISCEVCDISVSGGYDPEMNQVVVCQNVARSEGMVQGVLTHEFIHMFDYCNNDLDFKNIDHLACTEIRAANLSHCSFLSAWSQGDASPFKIKQAHQVFGGVILVFFRLIIVIFIFSRIVSKQKHLNRYFPFER